MKPRRQKFRISRTALVLAAALVCLLIVMIFSATIARSMIARDQSTKSDGYQLQCLWLVESGLARAVIKYRNDPTYAGEEWRVAIPAADSPLQGRVQIRVEPVADQINRRRIHVIAFYPDEEMKRVSQRREVIIPAGTPGET